MLLYALVYTTCMSSYPLSFRIPNDIMKKLEKLSKDGYGDSPGIVAKNILFSYMKEKFGLNLPTNVFDKILELENRIIDVEKQLAEGITLRKKSKD